MTSKTQATPVLPDFRPILLSDREKMEKLRLKYPSKLSDYTFVMLYCWQETLGLEVYIEEDMYIVKCGDGFFCPIGEKSSCKRVLDTLLFACGRIKLRFCDPEAERWLLSVYGETAKSSLCEDDCDYLVSNSSLCEFAGGKLHKRRGEYHHYRDLDPAPEVVCVTEENLDIIRGMHADASRLDARAADIAVDAFKELKLGGVIVSRGGKPLSYLLTSCQYEGVRQAHFCVCRDLEKGAMLYLVRAGALTGAGDGGIINLEDDMGEPGLRRFKQSFHGTKVLSYTVVLAEDQETGADTPINN